MKLLLVSPYHGGSHKAWAEGYQRFSRHQVKLLTLPGRYWKWRMHGGAITLARRFNESQYEPDLIVATDMLDLTTFLALSNGLRRPAPAFLFMHENQLTYPLPQDGSSGPMRRQLGERDRHYAFINFTSMLAANQVFFNSEYHRRSFFRELRSFLKHFPDFKELTSLQTLRKKSRVLPVGVDLARLSQTSISQSDLKKCTTVSTQQAPLILWNQRWEYDKNPAKFFQVLYQLEEENVNFRLAVCGQNFRRQPTEFQQARKRLSNRIIHWGYASEALYRKLLWQADVTVSTADHEFFGVSMVEAMCCQVFPVLPAALSYPELIPAKLQEHCLYSNQDQLLGQIRCALEHHEKTYEIARSLSRTMLRFDWSHLAPEYDRQFNTKEVLIDAL